MPRPDTILIVDDDAAIAELLVEVLTDAGYRVQMALDGTTALAFIVYHPPALLLLDLYMPNMSGRMVLAQLQAAGLLRMPVVLMTAATHDIPAPQERGVSAMLEKPFDLDALLACVARLLPPAPPNAEKSFAPYTSGADLLLPSSANLAAGQA